MCLCVTNRKRFRLLWLGLTRLCLCKQEAVPFAVIGSNTFVFVYNKQEAVPFAVVGSNTVIEVRGRKVRGRLYPWGVVEVENPEHCDFIKLRTLLVFVIFCICLCI